MWRVLRRRAGRVAFYALFAVAVTASVLVIGQRNPMYSVLLLILSFAALSGLYVQLGSPFVAVIQIIIYAGAIMVLFLFVIMLVHQRTVREMVTFQHQWDVALLFLIVFLVFTYGFGFFSTLLMAFLIDIDILYVARIARHLGGGDWIAPVIGLCTVDLSTYNPLTNPSLAYNCQSQGVAFCGEGDGVAVQFMVGGVV